jgi:hypothetical protein
MLPNDLRDYQRDSRTLKGENIHKYDIRKAFANGIMQASISVLKERKNICVVYDNFDYQKQVHHQIIGE